MAEIALAAVVRKVIDVAGNLIIEEGSRLYWLAEEMRWLENQLIHMQGYAAIAEPNQVTDPQVKNLISQVRNLAHDVEDTLDDYIPKIERYRSGGVIKKAANILHHSFMCSNFARKIQKIRRRVEAIDADRKTYGIQDIDARGVERRFHDPRIVALHVDEPVVVGFDKDIDDLKKKLLGREEGLLFVAIVGMAGVGKTTLAKKVFKSVKRRFNCSASITVSQQPKFADIFDNIAKQTGLSEVRRKENLEANLSEFLKGKRYFLLLDDIWDVETWNKLLVGIPIDCLKGSRIIITSRDTGIGRYIGHERSLHHLKPFDSLTSWRLFKELITPTFTSDNQELEDSTLGEIGKEIVEQCGGLPLALVVTVGMLRERGTSEEAWKMVLNSMMRDHKDKCSQILALSYNDLCLSLKPCFLYLGSFPEDHKIRVSELIRLWMGERFIETDDRFEPEEIGENYVNTLVSRNLVQVVSRKYNGRIKHIQIHDLLHSMCINTSKEINFLHTSLHTRTPKV